MKRQHTLRLFTVIVAFLFGLQIASAAPPAQSSDKVPQPAKPPVWTIPESEASYPALLMPQDYQGLNMVGYLKQSEDQALAQFAQQGYVKATPGQAAKLEQSLQTNVAFRLDVAGKTIAREKIAGQGARYVVVQKQKAAHASSQSTAAPPIKTASAENIAVPKPGGQ